jgi:hypothetical protein
MLHCAEKKKIIGFDKTRPSTLPCFPKMKFHVFCKDSPQMIVHPDAELYKVRLAPAPFATTAHSTGAWGRLMCANPVS